MCDKQLHFNICRDSSQPLYMQLKEQLLHYTGGIGGVVKVVSGASYFYPPVWNCPEAPESGLSGCVTNDWGSYYYIYSKTISNFNLYTDLGDFKVSGKALSSYKTPSSTIYNTDSCTSNKVVYNIPGDIANVFFHPDSRANCLFLDGHVESLARGQMEEGRLWNPNL
jgi:prepilin-type processing-associated H-X9-DG protein